MPKPGYSVVIPAYNSMRTIVPCLEAVTGQVDVRQGEVIVVDSSQDETPDVVKERFPDVTLIHSKKRLYPGEARSLGVERARGEVLLFIDSDCVACPGWVDGLVAIHGEEDCAGVGGSVVNGNPGLVSWAGYFLEFSRFFPRRRGRERVEHLPTCNISYKRRVFETYGTFPPDMYPVEDRVFNELLVRGGERIVFDPGLQVRHFHRSSLKGFLRHQALIGWGSASMRKKNAIKTSFIAKSPWLLPAILPAMLASRLFFVKKRILLHRIDLLPVFVLSSPLYLLGLSAWLFGFARETCRRG